MNDVRESVAEVDMSSANLVRVIRCLIGCNRLTKICLMMKNRELLVWKYTGTYRMMIKRERVAAQGDRARPLPQPRLPSRQEVQEHELTHIPYRSWCVHCVRVAGDPMRIEDEQDKIRKKRTIHNNLEHRLRVHD